MAGPQGHQPLRYLNHQHLHNIQPRNTGEKKLTEILQTKGRRAALIMTIPSVDNLHYISGGRQAFGEEKAAVNAAEYTMLMLLEGFGEEGLWLPVQAAQRTSHQKYPRHAHRTFTTAL